MTSDSSQRGRSALRGRVTGLAFAGVALLGLLVWWVFAEAETNACAIVDAASRSPDARGLRGREAVSAGRAGEASKALATRPFAPKPAPDEVVRARIVAQRPGDEAGVPVALYRRVAEGVRRLAEATSDAEGRVQLGHPDLARRGGGGLFLSFPFPIDDRPELAVPPQGSDVELELPLALSAALEIRLVDAKARPLVQPVQLHLVPWWPYKDSLREEREFVIESRSGVASAVVRDGLARFPRVATGWRFALLLEDPPPGFPEASFQYEIDTPGTTETRTIRAGIEGEPSRVVGTIVVPEEAELPNRIPSLKVLPPGAPDATGGEEESLERWGTLDAEGGFQFEFDVPPANLVGRDYVLEIPARGEEQVERGRFGVPDADGVFRVGSFRVGVRPLVLAGRVVDGRGEPVDGARLQLEWPGTDGDVVGTFLSTDENGSFALRTEPGFGEGALDLSHPGCVPVEEMRFREGDLDMEIRLQRGGVIDLRPEPVELWPLVDLRWVPDGLPPSSTEEGRSGLSPGAYSEGQFFSNPLPPGPGRLELFVGREPAPRRIIEDLTIVAGETCRDPRLEPLDLSCLDDHVHFEIQGQGCSSLERSSVRLWTPARGDFEALTPVWPATFAFREPKGPYRLTVEHAGFLARTLHRVPADHLVELEPAPAQWLEIVWPEGTDSREGTQRGLTLEWVDSEDPAPPYRPEVAHPFDFEIEWRRDLAQERPPHRLPARGRYRVRVWIQGEEGRRSHERPADLVVGEAAWTTWSVSWPEAWTSRPSEAVRDTGLEQPGR